MRARSSLALLTLLSASLLACRQPSAELQLEQPRGAEPSGIDSPSVFVEAATSPDGPLLDWRAFEGDTRFADLIDLADGQRYRVEYDVDHPWTGSRSPLVTIVVFTDYQCPYCKRLDDTLTNLLGQYGDVVRVVWRQFPLAMHRNAELAARYALAAHAQGSFGPMHDWLFANARDLSRATVQQHALSLGLDPQRLEADVDGGWIAERVALDKQFATSVGVNATPVFFVNGRHVSGAQPEAEIGAMIAEEVLAAERLIAAGSERREVWARFLAASATGPIVRPSPSPTPSPTPAKAKRYTMQLSGLPPRGATSPKVEILMCGDFDCPYSKRSTATLDELRKLHKTDLAVYFRHQPLPMHKHAMAAHRAAVAADNQGQFWAMFDLLYAEPKQRSAAEIEAMAKQLGLKLSQFRKDIADPKTDALIQQHSEVCEKQLDNRGTPGFYINGRPLSGAQPTAAFEAIIAEELGASGPGG